MSSEACLHKNTEVDHGVSVCIDCGTVVENFVIVSDVQFEQNAQGGNSMVGRNVNFDGRMCGRAEGEPTTITLEKGRRLILEVAEQLRINEHCRESAFNIFKMAVKRRFTRGRPRGHVIAACLYIVCRLEGSAQTLLDFSDALQVNVFELGSTYLYLANALCINVPFMDPCVYIIRYAHLLQFKDETNKVINTTLRLLNRMKKDFIHIGRRPSGLCGAALLVAARMHEFNRTPEDIIKIVKVCKTTLNKRLMEFGDTPSSRLTLEEFETIDLEEEHDPPSFIASRKKEALMLTEEEQTREVSRLKKQIERLLEEKQRKLKRVHSIQNNDADKEELEASKFIEEETISAITKFVEDGEMSFGGSEDVSSDYEARSSDKFSVLNTVGLSLATLENPFARPAESNSNGKRRREDEEEEEKEEEIEVSGILDLEGIDDKELDAYILTPQESKSKTALWLEINADYLQLLKEKEELQAQLEKDGVVKPEKKKRKKVVKKKNEEAASAGEAIEKMLMEKKLSKKINYEVLRSISSPFALPSSTPVASVRLPVPIAPSQPKQPNVDKSARALKEVSEPVPQLVQSIEESPLVYEDGPIEYAHDEDDEDDAPIRLDRSWGEEDDDYYD